MSKSIVIRIQSPQHGTKRVNVKPTERINDFLEKVKNAFELIDGGWKVWIDRSHKAEVSSSKSKTLSTYKIKHGDMLYLDLSECDMDFTDLAADTADINIRRSSVQSDRRPSIQAGDIRRASIQSLTKTGSQASLQNSAFVVEDDVDQYLWGKDGRITRSKNEQLCRHGPRGKCLHCVPLEPYDEQYLKSADPPIKFLSFHSYLRKLTGGVDKGKFANLENLSCKIKPGCKEHPPWPGGICTKCQPNAVTLNRQTYRHVDYIQFENPFIVEKFLNYWRNTGNQRIGFMYGRYESHKDVPLGIKAVVSAIYEPPQISQRNSVQILDDEAIDVVEGIAANLGLRRVGWIFTDLVAQDLKKGTVKHFRGNISSHFLSSEECIMAADFQTQYPNPCKLSPEGHFGSKFVTVVVTGDDSNQIHFEGYQVSNQCMALVRDDCLIPTKDAPELGYIKESSNEQYVPDVFYKVKDEYGNEVTQLARPLPVEYLLVDMPAAFPVEPEFTFTGGNKKKPFPVENRADIGEVQDFNAFASYMQQHSSDDFLEGISDFHLLNFIANCDMLPLKDQMSSLLEAVKNKDAVLAQHWASSEHWATVEQIMAAHAPVPSMREESFVGPGAAPLPPIADGAAGGSAMWTCAHCTFLNQPNTSTCEICSLPK